MTTQTLRIKRLHPEAIVPTYATDGSACFDLYAIGGKKADHANNYHVRPIFLRGGESAVFRTGLSFEVPSGYAMLIFSRSGHGFKENIRLSNCVGVIDSDYRGEVKVKLCKDNIESLGLDFQIISHGDRIAQAMLVPIPRVSLVEVDELSETERGAGGFGSTGA